MKKRILLLLHEDQLPPSSANELSTEFSPTWGNYDLLRTLEELGHEVRVLGLSDELVPIRHQVTGFQPHIVFNQLLEFHGHALYDAHVVSYLELLKVPYTGCNPRGILLASDKALAKKVMTFHRIPIPRFLSCPKGRALRPPRKLRYPLFVKSKVEHASLGIAQASIVHDFDELQQRVTFVHESVGSDAIAEEYIDGRELTIGVLGNSRLKTYPIWEMTFESLPPGTAPIATSQVKWNARYREKLGVKTHRARELEPAVERRIANIAKRTYRALGMSGYARIDLRLDAQGNVFVLEANPNPDITLGEDLAESAKAIDQSYGEFLNKLVRLGLAYPYAWRED